MDQTLKRKSPQRVAPGRPFRVNRLGGVASELDHRAELVTAGVAGVAVPDDAVAGELRELGSELLDAAGRTGRSHEIARERRDNGCSAVQGHERPPCSNRAGLIVPSMRARLLRFCGATKTVW